MSLLGKAIPTQAKLPACAIIAAGLVSIFQMLVNAFLPEIYQMLGIYVAVVAVNLVVFGQAEAAAAGNGVSHAVITGVYFTVMLLVMGVVRELFGNASIFGMDIAFLSNFRISLLSKAPGGFIIASILAGVISKLGMAKDECTGNCVTGVAAGIRECACACDEKEEVQ